MGRGGTGSGVLLRGRVAVEELDICHETRNSLML